MHSVLTTDGVPQRRRAEFWEEMVTRKFVAARCWPDRSAGFRASIRSLDLKQMTLSEVQSHGTDVVRTASHVSCSDEAYFLVSIQREGIGRLTQAGRSVVLRPGDIALYDTARAYDLNFEKSQKQTVIRIPHPALKSMDAHIEDRVALRIDRSSCTAMRLRELATKIFLLRRWPSERARDSMADCLINLITGGAVSNNSISADNHRGSLLPVAEQIANARRGDSTFTVSKWADALGISERYLRQLFRGSEFGPAQFLWRQRCILAASRLRDPAFAGKTITDIAMSSGFNDAAHFSRVFKSVTGARPRDYRMTN